MRHWPVALAAVVLALLSSSPAMAVSKPAFPRSLHGTLKGSLISTGGPETVVQTWKVTGVVFKRSSVVSRGGGWTARYKVVAGKVDYTLTQSGNCSFSAHAAFPLVKSLPRGGGARLALDKDAQGIFHTLGSMNPRHSVTTTETCRDPSTGQLTSSKRKLEAPTVFDPGGEPWVPGQTVRGEHDIKDLSTPVKTTRSWTWLLKTGK